MPKTDNDLLTGERTAVGRMLTDIEGYIEWMATKAVPADDLDIEAARQGVDRAYVHRVTAYLTSERGVLASALKQAVQALESQQNLLKELAGAVEDARRFRAGR